MTGELHFDFRWKQRFFCYVQTDCGARTASCPNGTKGVFPSGEATRHHHAPQYGVKE